MDKSLDNLVRDACSVVPVSKSEYRRRLQALISQEVSKGIREFAEKLERTDILAGLPAEATTVVLLEDIDQALTELEGGEGVGE